MRIVLSHRQPRDGASHRAAFRCGAVRSGFRARQRSATDGQSPMMNRSLPMHGLRAGSISRAAAKTEWRSIVSDSGLDSKSCQVFLTIRGCEFVRVSQAAV